LAHWELVIGYSEKPRVTRRGRIAQKTWRLGALPSFPWGFSPINIFTDGSGASKSHQASSPTGWAQWTYRLLLQPWPSRRSAFSFGLSWPGVSAAAGAVRLLLRLPAFPGLGGGGSLLRLAGDGRGHPQAALHHGGDAGPQPAAALAATSTAGMVRRTGRHGLAAPPQAWCTSPAAAPRCTSCGWPRTGARPATLRPHPGAPADRPPLDGARRALRKRRRTSIAAGPALANKGPGTWGFRTWGLGVRHCYFILANIKIAMSDPEPSGPARGPRHRPLPPAGIALGIPGGSHGAPSEATSSLLILFQIAGLDRHLRRHDPLHLIITLPMWSGS